MERMCKFSHALRSARGAGCTSAASSVILTSLWYKLSSNIVLTALFTLASCEKVVLFQVLNVLGLGQSPLSRFEKRPGQKALWPTAPIPSATDVHWPGRIPASKGWEHRSAPSLSLSISLFAPSLPPAVADVKGKVSTEKTILLLFLHWHEAGTDTQVMPQAKHGNAPKGKCSSSAGKLAKSTLFSLCFWMKKEDQVFWWLQSLYLYATSLLHSKLRVGKSILMPGSAWVGEHGDHHKSMQRNELLPCSRIVKIQTKPGFHRYECPKGLEFLNWHRH